MSFKKKYVYTVFSGPSEGMEKEYNDWYDTQHLPQVTKVPGIVAAQRFKLAEGDQGPYEAPARYLAIYEIETDGDPLKVVDKIREFVSEGKIVMSEVIDLNVTRPWMYGAIGERLVSKK